jgi:hypothetical protein
VPPAAGDRGPDSDPPRAKPSGTLAVIGIGTSGGTALTPSTDTAGDDALYALMDSAERTLRIDQEDLVSEVVRAGPVSIPQHASKKLLQHLASAIVRNVDVYLLLSGAFWSNGWTLVQSANAIRDAVLAKAAVAPDALCARLHIGLVRDRSGALVGNHAKVVIADQQAFYIGSQNLYPGGLSDPVLTSLAEYGYVVDDANATVGFMRSFWEPEWGAAARQEISGGDGNAACAFRSSPMGSGGSTRALGDCSTGWSTCGANEVCAWNGASSGYCCKLKWTGAQACPGDGDGYCGAGICSAGSATEHFCTVPDEQPCR